MLSILAGWLDLGSLILTVEPEQSCEWMRVCSENSVKWVFFDLRWSEWTGLLPSPNSKLFFICFPGSQSCRHTTGTDEERRKEGGGGEVLRVALNALNAPTRRSHSAPLPASHFSRLALPSLHFVPLLRHVTSLHFLCHTLARTKRVTFEEWRKRVVFI